MRSITAFLSAYIGYVKVPVAYACSDHRAKPVSHVKVTEMGFLTTCLSETHESCPRLTEPGAGVGFLVVNWIR